MARPPGFSAHDPVAYLVDPDSALTVDALGPKIQFLTPFEGPEAAPCVIRGMVPPGAFVPLHSHEDPETFVIISGALEALVQSAEGFRWVKIGPGGVLYVPGWAKHAWRNLSAVPASIICVTTAKLGRFLREIGQLAASEAPQAQRPSDLMAHFHEIAERYGYWLAAPEENAEVGLRTQ